MCAAADRGPLTRRDRRGASLLGHLEPLLRGLQIRLQLCAQPLLGVQRRLRPVPLKLDGLARFALLAEFAVKLGAF